jgi:hypothetical protein
MFCWYCGTVFEPPIPRQGMIKATRCKRCSKTTYGDWKYIPRIRFCIKCGAQIKIKSGKRCVACEPKKENHHFDYTSPDEVIRYECRCNVVKHQRIDIKKFDYTSPDEVIRYECRCNVVKKENHHFDYTRPDEVIRLCSSCHKQEHQRIDIKKPAYKSIYG